MNALSPTDALVQTFHRRHYDAHIPITFLGVPIGKLPGDLVIYAELLHRVQPDLLVECGTNAGGASLFFATIMDALGKGRVLTIDPFDRDDGEPRPVHPRVTYLQGSSLDPWTVTLVAAQARGQRTMVVLDSVHATEHVYAEMMSYCAFVTDGSYLVVENTNLNGHPVVPEHGPGPAEAVAAFLECTEDFVNNADCERFGVTANAGAWLRRVQGRPL